MLEIDYFFWICKMTFQSFKPQDHFFKKAKEQHFVARSIYKLQEIDEKYHFFGK